MIAQARNLQSDRTGDASRIHPQWDVSFIMSARRLRWLRCSSVVAVVSEWMCALRSSKVN